ncbi:MAG: DNA methyltransferase, partial [bacterium]
MNPIRDYLKSIEQDLVLGDATEHTHRAALETLLKSLSEDSVVTNEPKHIAVGAPDFVIRRKISKTQWLPIGYIETKDIDTELDLAEKSEQLKRYLKLDNLLLTDYLEFRWYVGGKIRTSARLARIEKGKPRLLKDGEEKVNELLLGFLKHEPLPISSPQELAKTMASLCRQIDGIVVDAFRANTASDLLRGLKEAFERTLLPDLSPEQFADMFAQTLAYGLFAARINHFRERPSEEFRRSEAAREIPKTNPFLRKLFDTITGADIEDEPFIGFVDDLTAVMQHADIGAILQHFGRRTGQEDPIVHFYETSLAAYDPKLRELRGVYYTPEPVVSYIVRSVDILLKEKFGLKDGLADRSTIEVKTEEDGVKKKRTLPKVLILDPACGTGTFLYAVIDLIRKRFMESGNAGEWSDFVREHLLPRIYGFELLMAPYAVAHLKLAMQLAGQDLDEPLRTQWAYDFHSDERLNIFLTNSLEYTEEKLRMQVGPFERFIADEAVAAHRIKGQWPIMVVLGNPPYSGHSANRSEWVQFIAYGSSYVKDGKEHVAGKKGAKVRRKTFIGELLNDYYFVDGEPLRERNPKWLQDDYVKFIRFGQWRIERTGHGILAYISNHAYLDNPTFRGMRQNLMRSFDEMYLLDLHGNAKKKEKAPDGGVDKNVFDIQQGVAIGIFLKGPASAAVGARRAVPAEVRKSDAFGLRERKYQWLFAHDLHSTEWASIEPDSPFYLFVKQETQLRSEYQKGWAINSIMPVNSVGIVTARDDLTIRWTAQEMESVVKDFVSLPVEEAREKYNLGK